MRYLTLLITVFVSSWVTFGQPGDYITYAEETNFSETPKHSEVVDFCKLLEKASDMVNYTTFGVSPQGRDLSLLIVDKDGLTTPEAIRAKGRVIMLVNACIHAGEPDGKDAGLIFIRDMVVHKKNINLLNNVSLLFVPIFNVDGHENYSATNRINQNGPNQLGTRWTSNLLNMNRDFLKADAPEMRSWLKLYSRWLPELFIDVHVTNGADFQYVSTYAIDNGGTFMQEDVRNWSIDFEEKLNSKMAKAGYPLMVYFHFLEKDSPESGLRKDVMNPKYSNGYAAARNRVGLLIENHIYKPYRDRVDCTIKYFISAMEILNKEHKSLKDAIAKADAYVASPAFREEPFDFRFKTSFVDPIDIEFLGWERDTIKSELTGATRIIHNYNKPITYKTKYYNKYESTSSVMLPSKYIIMPQYSEVVEILKLHGVEMTRLDKDTEVDVETYRFTDAKFSSRHTEGRVTASTKYTTQRETLIAPKGSYVVDMNQPSARIMPWMVEPSAPESLVYWGFFNSVIQAPSEFWIRPDYMEVKAPEMMEKSPELKARFEKRMREDSEFASDPDAIYQFFYEIVKKQSEQNNELHPIWRVL